MDWSRPSPRTKESGGAGAGGGGGAGAVGGNLANMAAAKSHNPAAVARSRASRRAVAEVRSVLKTQPRDKAGNEVVPLGLMPYFRFLNDEGKRSIMNQVCGGVFVKN